MGIQEGKRFLSESEMLLQERGWFDMARPIEGLQQPTEGTCRNEDIKAVRQQLNEANRSALCLSGGGIRSSSFCLGVLQELADGGFLSRFDYLSTVSGGGFVGSWFTSRLYQEHPEHAADDLMKAGASSGELREVSRYLAMENRQVWDFAGVFVRNLVLNWLALIPLIMGMMALVSAIPPLFRKLILISLALAFCVGAVVTILPTSLKPTGHMRNLGTRVMAVSLQWFLVIGIGFALSNDIRDRIGGITVLGIGILIGILAVALRVLTTLRTPDRSTPPWLLVLALLFHVGSLAVSSWIVQDMAKAVTNQRPPYQGLVNRSLHAAMTALGSWATLLEATGPALFVCGLGLVLFGLLFSLLDPNRISLHGIYRDRIGKAFVRDGPTALMAGANYVSGKAPPPRGPFHVINTTVNDPTSSGATQAERRGHSFVFTPLHAGYASARSLATLNGSKTLDLGQYRVRTGTLPMATSLAISGAAFSPQMGTYGSSLLAYPFTLLNARLGYWMRWRATSLPNFLQRLAFSVLARIYEAIPPLPRGTGHLYLTDGGHFDNLGLYEMVRRRCRYILILDGGRDSGRQFGALASAIRRIRTDFDVDITINDLETKASLYRGTIHYSNANPDEQDGTLVYLRPEIGLREPADVSSYGRLHGHFPHESTADQFFSESQFESYRNLGRFTLANALQSYHNDKGTWAIRAESAGDLVYMLAEVASKRRLGAPDLAGGIVYRIVDGKVQVLLTEDIDKLLAVLPKGHVELGESLQEAAQREIQEETGLTFKIDRDCNVVFGHFKRDGKRVDVAYFLLDYASGRIVDTDLAWENRATFWMTIPESSGTNPSVEAVEASRSRTRPREGQLRDLARANMTHRKPEVPKDIVKLLVEQTVGIRGG